MSRKGENIFHRKDGRWEARYIKGYKLDGSYLYGYVYAKTYKEVKYKRTEILMNLKKEKTNTSLSKKYFLYKIDEWLNIQKISIKASTYVYYSSVVNKHILPDLGKCLLTDINNEKVGTFIQNKIDNSGLKITTIREIVIILKQILKFCNIEIKIKMPKKAKSTIPILSNNEQEKLKIYLFSNIDEINIGILLSLYSGLRIGEVCALRWKDIDFYNGIIKVKYTLSRVKNNEATGSKTCLELLPAKTNNSVRIIPINEKFLSILKNLKPSNDDTYILTSTMNVMDPRTYYNKYKRILKKINLDSYNYHALRHTFATNCISLGLDPKSLSEILGHSDINVTLSFYVHPDIQLKKEFMNSKFECLENN